MQVQFPRSDAIARALGRLTQLSQLSMCLPMIRGQHEEPSAAPSEQSVRQDYGIWGAELGGLTSLAALHLNIWEWGWVTVLNLLHETLHTVSALTALEQLTLDVCEIEGLPALTKDALASLPRLTKLRVLCGMDEACVEMVDAASAAALARVAVCELPQLRELHLPVTAAPGGGEELVATLLGATHLQHLTLDLYVSTAHFLDGLGDFLDDPDLPEPSDFLAQYTPLFPHLCTVNAFCWRDCRWMQPLVAQASQLTRLHALRLTCERPLEYYGTVNAILQALVCLGSLRELSLCGFAIPYHAGAEALQRLTQLTALDITGQTLANVGEDPRLALPRSLEKLTVRNYLAEHAQQADAHVSALAPLHLKMMLVYPNSEDDGGHSLRMLVQQLPRLDDLSMRVSTKHGCSGDGEGEGVASTADLEAEHQLSISMMAVEL